MKHIGSIVANKYAINILFPMSRQYGPIEQHGCLRGGGEPGGGHCGGRENGAVARPGQQVGDAAGSPSGHALAQPHHPRVQISLGLSDRFIDVVSEGFDLVLRIAALEDSSLIARKIAPCRRVLCASPEYLKQNGLPRVPQDLAIHPCLVYSNDLKPDTWVLHGPSGEESVGVNGPVCADNGDILKAAAAAGLGIALLPTFIVGPELRAGRLKQVLPGYCPPEISIYAGFPSRRYLSAKVRTFVDFLSDYIGENPDWGSI